MSGVPDNKRPSKNAAQDDMPSLVTPGEDSLQDSLNPSAGPILGEDEYGEEEEDEDSGEYQTRKKKKCGKGQFYDDDDDGEEGNEMELKKKRKSHKEQEVAEDPEVDFETLVKEEFKKLHRQYRLMEDARHAIAGAGSNLGKQARLLENLKAEKEDLLTDLKNCRCRQYKARDKQTINTILEALERYEKYQSDITSCLVNIAEMEENVDKISKRLTEQRLKVQAKYGRNMTVPKADHRIMILENRLYHVTTHYSTLVSENRDLKVDINMMLKLRGSFYRRMLFIKKLSGKIKQRMGEVVYEATAAYDQRDDCMNKIAVLRERNDKDSKQHVLEIKEFQRVLHNDSKIHEFLAIKNKERELFETLAQRLDRKNRGKMHELDALLAAYKRSFRAILRMAKTRDVDSLVHAYLEEEHKNFTLFKYITDLNHETSCLQDDIGRIKDEIEQLSREARLNGIREEDTLTDYDNQVDEATKKLDGTLKEWSAADKTLEEFGNLLDQAFSLAGCSNAPILALLGNENGMGPHNICLCMKALEHRVTELMFEKALLEVRKSVEIDGNPLPKKVQLWVQGSKPPPQGGPFKPIVHVTGRVDSEQEEDDVDVKRPIYYDEIKQIIKQSMQPEPSPGDEGGNEAPKERPRTRAGKAQSSAIPSKKKPESSATAETEQPEPSSTDVEPSTEAEEPETAAGEEPQDTEEAEA